MENRDKGPAPAEANPGPLRGLGAWEKVKDLVLYEDEGYNAFPSILQTGDGNYLLAFRHAPHTGGAYTHIDPASATYVVKSADGCESWGPPREIRRPGGWGGQDPTLNVLSDGTVLMTVFFWRFADAARKPLLEQVLAGGFTVHGAMGMAAYCGGAYAYISRDHGETWDGPHLITENYAVRGRCAQLPDGVVLVPVYNNDRTALFASRDGGLTWEPYSLVSGPLDKSRTAHEPALLRTQSGRIFCFIRTDDGMYYSVSGDGGRNFSGPVATGLPGHVPYDALLLPGGNVYLAYGHRKEPYGIRALLLDGECNGIAADREFILRDDGLGGDISYVSSAVLPQGGILTAYYYYTREHGQRRYIAGTVLREKSAPSQ